MAVVARYANGIERIHECIAARFQRPEPRPTGIGLSAGPAQPGERKNRWQLAKQAGYATPDGMQCLLSTPAFVRAGSTVETPAWFEAVSGSMRWGI